MLLYKEGTPQTLSPPKQHAQTASSYSHARSLPVVVIPSHTIYLVLSLLHCSLANTRVVQPSYLLFCNVRDGESSTPQRANHYNNYSPGPYVFYTVTTPRFASHLPRLILTWVWMLLSAPSCSSSWTTSRWPLMLAMMREVSPTCEQ